MVKAFITYANSARGRLHRWVSGIVAVYVIMAALSGIIHIIMANFYQPPPPVAAGNH
jgi:ABC-type multidrug transport system permease subunit